MADQDPEITEIEVDGASLKERMSARAEELSRQRTGFFDVPGYEGLLEVELRTLGFRTVRANVERTRGVRDPGERELYAMIDNLVAATIGFREVYGNGKPPRVLQDTWTSLAERLPQCPEHPSPRVAVLFLLGDDRVMFLLEAWTAWQRQGRDEVDEEVARDFTRTG